MPRRADRCVRPRRGRAAELPSLALVVFALAACAGSGGTAAEELDGQRFTSDAHGFRVEVVAADLEHPWGLAFLPDGRALVTERPGRLQLIDPATGERTEVAGAPEVSAVGQGGLLDVALHPDYPQTAWIYLTWAATHGGGNQYATHVGRARLDADTPRLHELETLHVATPASTTTAHFGSRIVFDGDGYLFVTSGDRRDRDSAQDLQSLRGKTLRLTADGDIPADNPFVDDEADAAIYSYGHRNAQGMALHPETGEVWQSEHGPRAGDEINRLVAGGNFGWPIASYGREYSTGADIGDLPSDRPDTEQPVYYWSERSFSPSGLAVYGGGAFPGWAGDVFVGSLARTNLTRLAMGDGAVIAEEALLADEGLRIRDVRVGPDGHLHLLVDAASAPWLRLVPAD